MFTFTQFSLNSVCFFQKDCLSNIFSKTFYFPENIYFCQFFSPPSAVEDPFTPSQILRAHSAIARVNAALKRRGKEALPVHLYRHPIP